MRVYSNKVSASNSESSEIPYLVTFGWDQGGPESGPIWKGDTDIVYAYSEEDACKKWEAENLDQFQSGFGEYGGYEGCWARPATPEEVEEYSRMMQEYNAAFDEMQEYDAAFNGPSYISESRNVKSAQWNYTLKCGDKLRSAINSEDPIRVVNVLKDAYGELLDAGFIDNDDYYRYVSELDFYDPDDEDLEDSVDYNLEDFWDLCDELRVWVPV